MWYSVSPKVDTLIDYFTPEIRSPKHQGLANIKTQTLRDEQQY